MILNRFFSFLEEMNLSRTIISLLISKTIADFVTYLINVIIAPLTKKVAINNLDKAGNWTIKFMDTEVDVLEIINRGMTVFISLFIIFIFYEFFIRRVQIPI